jgi:heterotetrameric sarcosine oxidase gamma subunit
MRFEFLAPDGSEPVAGVAPARRSPIEWEHRNAGAELGERAGWRVVRGYGNAPKEAAACARSVGVADVSYLGKLELQAEPAVAASIVAELAGGASLRLGQAAHHGDVWWCPVTAGRVLAIAEPEDTGRVRDAMEAAAAAAPSWASVLELTAAYGSNAVTGSLSRETFARATALDLRPARFPLGGFAPVSVARTPGMILRTGPDAFLHLFGAGYASYNWTVFVDAAQSLGGRAVGVDALGALAASEVGANA